MGLLLHRLKKNYVVKAAAQVVVDTNAPESFSLLFRQRSKSWDLCAQRRVLYYLGVSSALAFTSLPTP